MYKSTGVIFRGFTKQFIFVKINMLMEEIRERIKTIATKIRGFADRL